MESVRWSTARLVVPTVLTLTVVILLWSLGVRAVPSGAGAPGVDARVEPEFASAPGGRRLAWVDRSGRLTFIATPARGYTYPRLSPDGRTAVVDIRDAHHGLWVWSVSRNALVPLSTGRVSDISPVWSRSGRWLLFSRGRGVSPGLFRIEMDRTAGGGVPGRGRRLPAESNSLLMPSSLLPDDRHLLVTTSAPAGFDVWLIDLQGDGIPVPFVTSAADDLNAEASPDGRWVAYQSRASGQFDIWLRPLQGDGIARAVTTDGGTRPVWTRGGRELVYLTTDGVMMARSIDAAGPGIPRVGPPERLFDRDIYRDLVGRTFDVTPDGERFLVIVGPERGIAMPAARP